MHQSNINPNVITSRYQTQHKSLSISKKHHPE